MSAPVYVLAVLDDTAAMLRAIAPAERIAEIEAELRAYREGWVQFDREHVKHLQLQLAVLRELEAAEANLRG